MAGFAEADQTGFCRNGSDVFAEYPY